MVVLNQVFTSVPVFNGTIPVMPRLVSTFNIVAMLLKGEEDNSNLIYGETTICESIFYGGSANMPTNTLSSFSHLAKDYV
jgi:hypothetical protein